MKAKGRWPFNASGIPTTAASAMEGCEVTACSIAPVLISIGSSSITNDIEYERK